MKQIRLAFMSVTAAYMIGGMYLDSSEFHNAFEVGAIPGLALFLLDE